jgi:hypothetical protein
VKVRRPYFFAVAALVCVILVPLSTASLRWVPEVMAATYVVLALLSALDEYSRARRKPQDD